MSGQDLQALFANLKPRSQNSNSVTSPDSTHENSGPFAAASPSPLSPPPPFPTEKTTSAGMNEHTTPQSQNLLNLLNFGQPSSVPDKNKSSLQESKQQRSISASDLVARLMSPTSETPASHETSKEEERISGYSVNVSQSTNPILDLLKSKSPIPLKPVTQEEKDVKSEASVTKESVERTSSPMRIFGSVASRETTPFEAPGSTPKETPQKPLFTYQNPFEALKASRTNTPRNTTPSVPTEKHEEIHTSQVGADDVPHETVEEKVEEPLREPTPFTAGKQNFDHTNNPSFNQEDLSKTQSLPYREGKKHVIETVEGKAMNDSNNELQDNSGEWEDIPEPPSTKDSDRVVPVLNFPIRAFVSITLQLGQTPAMSLRDEGILEISRIKKDFDQIDRSLAAATSKYITYAFVKHGGLRIIRQDDGKDRHVFKHTQDRIFNVSICTTSANGPPSDDQAVLGTGVSGAVYYASISKNGNDLFERNELHSESLIFPAYPQSDENTAGGLLKTRARRSSRHPEFFAIGRGKFINLVWPAVAMSSKYGVNESNRQVDIEKLFQERALQISTGKAGKDFVFSEDDTMIVSLDKTGRLRFWDIRKLVEEENATAARTTPIIVDTPLLSLMTASPAERSWPTSVLFVDKARPYLKGGALRYVLVGLRQNHTLQLWDIALGKAVQEINFPHESEVDGICSVNYHPGSGIIIVGHPTRNSLFFIHLSAPRYTLSSLLTQASYVQRVAAKDPDIPKPDSTACMSGIREVSFTDRGQLRSVELLTLAKPSDVSKSSEEHQNLFELYVVHSKGVTCVAINKEDLGWNDDNKIIKSIDAEKEGLITLKELKLGSVIEEPTREKSPSKEVPQALPTTKTSKKKSKKAKEQNDDMTNVPDENHKSLAPVVGSGLHDMSVTDSNPPEVSSAKENKKATQKALQEAILTSDPQNHELQTSRSLIGPSGMVNDKLSEPIKQDSTQVFKPEAVSMGISGDWLDKEIKKIERTVSSEFKKEFDILYQNIQKDRVLQDQSSASRQEAILRLVSSSLNDNVERSLSRILETQMREVAVPAVTQSVTGQLTDNITKSLAKAVPQRIEASLPNILKTNLEASQLSNTVSDALSHKLASVCQRQITNAVNDILAPALSDILSTAMNGAIAATENKLSSQIHQLQLQNRESQEKIDQMGTVLESLASTLRTMSETQVSFQNQILKERRNNVAGGDTSTAAPSNQQMIPSTSGPQIAPAKVKTKAEIELDEVSTLMEQQKYEEGSIKWLQSSQPVKLFDDLFVKFTPEYLATDVSPLVAFSIAVTVANTLNTNTRRRLEWISTAFDAVDFRDQEIIELSEHAPQLISSMISKLESLYMSIAEHDNNNPLLQVILPVAKKARDLKASFQAVYSGS